MKVLIAIAFVAILGALGYAGVAMVRGRHEQGQGQQRKKDMARALAVRVALSVALFLCILLAYKLGWIQPTGVPAGR
jgi:formate hydrogenlyase subunit 3/multisubunit Na+/H+ antiporter MnhD subunit